MRSTILLCYVFTSVFGATQICNTGTRLECVCSECWQSDGTKSEETIDWVSISLHDCPSRFNDTTFRSKLASWVNEECGSGLGCDLAGAVRGEDVVMGHWECSEERREMRVLVVKGGATAEGEKSIRAADVLPAASLGRVLQSREHLLSFLLDTELVAVTIHRRFKETRQVSVRGFRVHLPLLVLSAGAVAVLLVAALVVYVSQAYIDWRRVVKGRWQQREYSRVVQTATTSAASSRPVSQGEAEEGRA